MRHLLPLVVLCAAACSDANPDVTEQPIPTPVAVTEPTGTCPAIDGSGTYTLESDGIEREVRIFLPDGDTAGKPLLFLWYGVGDNGSNFSRALRAEAMASDEDVIIVVPESLEDNLFEWGFRSEGDHDLPLYDDLRSCLHTDLGIDLTRVYSSGFSAGGLWTTYLTMHRSDTLAAVLPFSGGTEPIVEYERPEWDIPVLLSWGGDRDTWGIPGVFEVDFQATSLDFEAELVNDEHLVIRCDHGLGHTVPRQGLSMITTFLFAHRYGEPSPFRDGDLSELPDFCERSAP